ncbi:MAG: hypothetical protein KKB62_02465 [Nanoarchaeota archaeon]|nr:hypothetical protein [Nanoarchaeota archaeon]
MKGVKNFLKKIGKFLVYGTLINQLSLPIIQSISMNVTPLTLRKDLINLEEIADIRKMDGYESFNSLDYLNLANFLVHLNKKEGDDCKNFAYSTFDNYQKIIEKDKRKKLSDKIRIASGYSIEGGHIWIEYKKGKNWLPYETTKNTSIEDIKNMKMYSSLNFHRRLNFDEKDAHSIKGTKILYPLPESFFRGYGLLEIPIRMWKHFFK